MGSNYSLGVENNFPIYITIYDVMTDTVHDTTPTFVVHFLFFPQVNLK
jgi:hypothetical protein